MATTKNITMKQFNGTDYDTLYPKTKVEQVENLTPSSIGAVSKSGDTMTGTYLGFNNGKGQIVASDDANNRLFMIRSTFNDDWSGIQMEASLSGTSDPVFNIYKNVNQAITHVGTMLHTGNAQSLGFPKIATGSYVGTGYSGQSHPMSINVGFAPKLFWICLELDDRRNEGNFVALTIPGGSTEDSNGLFIYPFTKYYCSPGSNSQYYVTVTWGSTMSWYGYVDFNDTEHGKYQFNKAGTTYYWVAIG